VWDQLPLPKARAAVPAPAAAAGALDRAQAGLADLAAQRGVRERHPLPMSCRWPSAGPDRDGLALDRLHVALGPVLPDWPAGLALHLGAFAVVAAPEARQLTDYRGLSRRGHAGQPLLLPALDRAGVPVY
jgi:hypothetical protein